MRLKKWKSFLSIFMASALMMSTAAYGNPVVITPLEESQVASFQSGSPAQGQGADGSYGSSGTGSVGPENLPSVISAMVFPSSGSEEIASVV